MKNVKYVKYVEYVKYVKYGEAQRSFIMSLINQNEVQATIF